MIHQSLESEIAIRSLFAELVTYMTRFCKISLNVTFDIFVIFIAKGHPINFTMVAISHLELPEIM